jgi:hypothetical protein
MRLARQTTSPRHLAGAEREPWVPREADFDVEAAFEPDFDFDALFAADDLPDEPEPAKARISPRRVAVALSVTLAALPLLFLDNFQATASTPSQVDASQQHDGLDPTGPPIPDRIPTTEAPPTTAAPLPQAVVFQADATTTSSEAPTSTEAPTTSTTVATRFVAAAKPVVIVTTTTTAPPAPTTTAAPKVAVARTSPDPDAQSTWETLAKCESGGNWAADTGNGYYGGLQFSLATWHGLGADGYPNQASKATQIAMGKKLQAHSGWNAWPGCARKLGWE